VAELTGISNIFDDAYVEKYEEESKSAVLKSGDMRIKIKSQNLKSGDKISWGIHPENITLLRDDSDSEGRDENIYPAHVNVSKIKDLKTRISSNLSTNKSLTAELPAQFVDSLKLHAGGSCMVRLEMSNIVAFHGF
jgi:molybdate transport system ATP-binding protein